MAIDYDDASEPVFHQSQHHVLNERAIRGLRYLHCSGIRFEAARHTVRQNGAIIALTRFAICRHIATGAVISAPLLATP